MTYYESFQDFWDSQGLEIIEIRTERSVKRIKYANHMTITKEQFNRFEEILKKIHPSVEVGLQMLMFTGLNFEEITFISKNYKKLKAKYAKKNRTIRDCKKATNKKRKKEARQSMVHLP